MKPTTKRPVQSEKTFGGKTLFPEHIFPVRRASCAWARLLALFLLVPAGCIQRSVRIDSEPAGARVFFDHRDAGRTPLELRFTHYGGHSLILTKDGYRPWRGRLELDEKGWAVFPLDIITEALLPNVLEDRRGIRVELQKAEGGGPPVSGGQEQDSD